MRDVLFLVLLEESLDRPPPTRGILDILLEMLQLLLCLLLLRQEAVPLLERLLEHLAIRMPLPYVQLLLGQAEALLQVVQVVRVHMFFLRVIE